MIVVPLSTSAAQAGRGPTAIPISVGTGGLERDSTALCHQVTTIDRAKLTKRLGLLPDWLLAEVNEGLKIAQDLS